MLFDLSSFLLSSPNGVPFGYFDFWIRNGEVKVTQSESEIERILSFSFSCSSDLCFTRIFHTKSFISSKSTQHSKKLSVYFIHTEARNTQPSANHLPTQSRYIAYIFTLFSKGHEVVSDHPSHHNRFHCPSSFM